MAVLRGRNLLDKEQTLKDLRHQLDIAIKERRKQASGRFDEVIRIVPSGIHQPDGRERILKASREYSEAQEAVTAALLAVNFLLGVKPPDFETEKGRHQLGAAVSNNVLAEFLSRSFVDYPSALGSFVSLLEVLSDIVLQRGYRIRVRL